MARTTRAASKRKREDLNGSTVNREIRVVTEKVSKQNAARNKRAAKRRRALGTLTTNKKVARKNPKPKETPKSCSPSGDYQCTGTVDDIDKRDAENSLCVTEYAQDMYEYFRQKETSTPAFMEKQLLINERMRAILVDWLVEVHLKFKLVPETLYLTVNLVDRFLARKQVSHPNLQLVGVTSLWIASKYEEVYPPDLCELVCICDRAYSHDEIVEMEDEMLKTLEYQVTIASAHAFLVRFLKAAHADKKIVQLSCYLLDGTLLSSPLLQQYLPSQLAAAAVFIARNTVGRNSWSPTLLRYSTYRQEEVAPVARAILSSKESLSTELQAVHNKYAKARYGGVAKMKIEKYRHHHDCHERKSFV